MLEIHCPLLCSRKNKELKLSELIYFDDAFKNGISNPTKAWCAAEQMLVLVKCRWEWESNLIARCKKTTLLLQTNEGEKAITAPFHFKTRIFKTFHETLYVFRKCKAVEMKTKFLFVMRKRSGKTASFQTIFLRKV